MNANKKSPKVARFFECKKCNYLSSKESDFNKHLLTSKHKMLTNTNKMATNVATDAFACICGKKYKYHSSLCFHKKKCSFYNEKDQAINQRKDQGNNQEKDQEINRERDQGNNEEKESKKLLLEFAIHYGDWSLARESVNGLIQFNPDREICEFMASIEMGEFNDVQKRDAWILRSENANLSEIWICQVTNMPQNNWNSVSDSGHFNSLEWRSPKMLGTNIINNE